MKKLLENTKFFLKPLTAVLVFSIFLKMDSILSLTSIFVVMGWLLHFIIVVIVLIRMIFAALVVLIILPPILGFKNLPGWLAVNLKIDPKNIATGLLSFLIFASLATIISMGMGIMNIDPETLFTAPDILPDPDVIGWGYFLLALIPGIWEELAFRGLIQSKCQTFFTAKMSVLLSSLFFSLFHFSNLITQPPAQTIPGVIMAFFFGIGWGFLAIRAKSIIPAMISHYLVDSLGQLFLNVGSVNPILTTVYILSLTLLFPLFNILLAKIVYKVRGKKQEQNEFSKRRSHETI